MNAELARLVAIDSFKASALLGDLVPILKQHLPQSEYEPIAMALADCSARIGLEVLNVIFAEHPSLEIELGERVRNYGRVF